MLKFSQILHYYLCFFIVQKAIAMIIDTEHKSTETMTESYKVFSILSSLVDWPEMKKLVNYIKQFYWFYHCLDIFMSPS